MAKNTPKPQADTVKDTQTPMDPEVEAKRSGPPPGMDNPQPQPEPRYVSEAEGDHNSEIIAVIDQMLKDPTFDTSGVYRLRLAEYTRRLPGKRYPATTDTDERGDPEGQEPHR